MSRPCKWCNSTQHTQFYCYQKPRKPLPKPTKQITQQGKEYERWKKFREEVAIPYLDKTFGHFCRCCKRSDVPLDIDHIHNKGSQPGLKYQLSNLQYLCRACHRNKTDCIQCSHFVL